MICFADTTTRDELVLANLGLCYFVAKKLCRVNPVVKAMGYDEVVSFCLAGIVEMAERFDPERSTFSTYYVRYMSKELVEEATRWYERRCISMERDSFLAPENEFPFDLELVGPLLDSITGRDRELVERHYGLNGRTAEDMRELALAEGLTIGRISVLIGRALRAMRRASKIKDIIGL